MGKVKPNPASGGMIRILPNEKASVTNSPTDQHLPFIWDKKESYNEGDELNHYKKVKALIQYGKKKHTIEIIIPTKPKARQEELKAVV